MQTFLMLVVLLIALPLAALFYVPALVMAALVRLLMGIKADDQERIEDLRKVCLTIWAIVLTAFLLIMG